MAALGEGGGDGAAGDERNVVLGRRTAEDDRDRAVGLDACRLPARPVTREHDLEDELDAALRDGRRRDLLAQPADVGGRAVLVVDDEVGVLLADRRAADARALEAEPIDERAGREPSAGLRKTLPADGMPERLVRLAPAADLVEALGDDVRIGRLELEGRPGHDVGRARRRVLEALSR